MSETISLVFETFKTCAIEIDTLLKNPSTDYLASQNSSGDMQLKIDVQADKLIEQKLLAIESIKGVCSEEKQEAVYKADSNARLLVAYDPLDGSSLVDSNLSIGTIFGIYDEVLESRALVASGYIVYGPRLEIVLAHKQVEHWRYCAGAWHALGILQLKQFSGAHLPNHVHQHHQQLAVTLVIGFQESIGQHIIPCQHCRLVAEHGPYGSIAPTHISHIHHIVMHQRSRMHNFNQGSGQIRLFRQFLPEKLVRVKNQHGTKLFPL